MPTIEIIFDDKGQTTIEAVGFKGKTCEKATQAYEQALGGKVSNKRRKSEYYHATTTTQTHVGK